MHSREAGVIRARSISSVAPSTNSPILSIDGIIWSRGEKASIVRAAIPAVDFAAAGMELIYVNMVIENAREDALGALRAMQWAVFERSIRRMLRFVSRAILSAAGISPLPAVEEGYLHLSTLVFIPAEIERKICEMEDALVVANEEDAHRALHDVDDITVKVRNLIHSGLFPSSFLSPTDWQKTLDIGYDWARLGAFLDADFPLEQARDLVATGGHQPAIKSVQVEVA